MNNYRILRVSHLFYHRALDILFQKYPDLTTKSYKEQLEIFFSCAFVYTDGFSRAMRQLGNEAYEIVYDLEWLQKTWAKEKGTKYNEQNWQQDILLSQICAIKPDVVYFQHSPPMSHQAFKTLKQDYSFIKKVVVHRGFPGDFDTLTYTDLLLIGTPQMVKRYEEKGLNSRLVYHYFDESFLEKIPVQKNTGNHDFTFTGSSGYGFGLAHLPRYKMLIELLQRTPITVWLDERDKPSKPKILNPPFNFKVFFRHLIKVAIGLLPKSFQSYIATTNTVPLKIQNIVNENLQKAKPTVSDQILPKVRIRDVFPNRCYSPLFGLEMFRILSESKVTFNRHVTTALDNDVGNLRMFQATGMGACLLTDTGKNMPDLFDEDTEVVTYSSTEECVEKLDYLLKHDDKRREIARAGQRRTLRDHTAQKRCEQIHEWLNELL